MRHPLKHSQPLRARLLLRLLAAGPCRRGERGSTMVAAAVVATLVLILSSAAMLQLSGGNLAGVFASSDSRQAQGAAVEGAGLMIDTWNQPQNRALLVSGTDPETWSSGDELLRSPCINSDGTAARPGGDGRPTQAAINLGDGAWRDVVTGETRNPNQDGRHFQLVRIEYTASDGTATSNPRALRRSADVGEGASGAAIPEGGWRTRVNLRAPRNPDPNTSDPPGPGRNSGFLILTVQGRVVRGGQVVANSQVTREFEVLPKCCGASLGSQGSGGVNRTQQSLGSDSRFCGLQWGIITGINGGTHWSYFANDRFTTRNADGSVTSLATMLGALKPGETLFERSNCRVIPTPNNSACNPSQSFQDQSFGANFRGATPRANCIQPAGSSAFFPGTENDILGKSISCVPIIPITLGSLPRIADRYRFNWPSGSGPANRIQSGAYPSISSSTANDKYVIRTNNTTSPPRVEVCIGNGTAPCTSSSWKDVTADVPAGDVADDFSSGGYGGSTGTNSWTGNWVENDAAGTSQSPTAGDVRIVSTRIRLTDNSGTGSTPAQRAAISRSVNLSAASTPVTLTFDFSDTGISGSENVVVEARSGSSETYAILGTYNTTSNASVDLTPYVSATTQIRFRVNANIGNSDAAFIDNVRISWPQENGWCAYSARSPVTAAPGFHCLSPSVSLANGAQWLIDTTGGPLTFYYSEPTDSRGLSAANPLIEMNAGSSLAHVRCNTLENNCTTPVDDTVFSPAGEPDRLNFFGRDRGNSAITQHILVNSQFNSPVKISGAWFYFPEGDLTLNVNDCSASQPSNFYTNNDNWTFSGRVWVKNFKPCGAFHFRVPPSSLIDPTNLFGAIDTPGEMSFVTWQGEDWVARAVTSTRLW